MASHFTFPVGKCPFSKVQMEPHPCRTLCMLCQQIHTIPSASRSVQSWAHTAGWARVLHGNTSFQLGRRSQHASQGAAWGHGCMGDTCLGKVSLRPVSTQKQRQEISQRWGLTGSLGTQSSVTVASPSFPGVTPGSSPTMPCQEEYPFLN